MLSRQYLAPSYHRGATEHAHALEVLAELLGGGPTSRLYRRLYYSGDSYDLATFSVYGTPLPGGDPAAVEKAVDAEIHRLLETGVTQAEVDRAKSMLQAGAIKARDSLSAPARTIGAALTTGGSIADVETWPEHIGAVTVEQVNAAARAVLRPEGSVTGLLLPQPSS
jgi:zinc protease